MYSVYSVVHINHELHIRGSSDAQRADTKLWSFIFHQLFKQHNRLQSAAQVAAYMYPHPIMPQPMMPTLILHNLFYSLSLPTNIYHTIYFQVEKPRIFHFLPSFIILLNPITFENTSDFICEIFCIVWSPAISYCPTSNIG